LSEMWVNVVTMVILHKRLYSCVWHGMGMVLADCSRRRVHNIDPYMVLYMLLYKGRFYVCGRGLGTSMGDCSSWKEST